MLTVYVTHYKSPTTITTTITTTTMIAYLTRNLKKHIPIFTMSILGGFFSILIVIFGLLWCTYYIKHLIIVKRKIKAIRASNNPNDRDRYINAVIDYKKSIFIIIISFTESWLNMLYWSLASFQHPKHLKIPYFTDLLENDIIFDLVIILSMTVFIILSSSVCILTSYLAKAYGTKREIKLKEKYLFIWLATQVLIGMLVSLIPNVKSELIPLYLLGIMVIHIVMYVRLARKLHSVLRMRRIDAYFEDQQQHKQMIKMCKNFKLGAILYTATILMWLVELSIAILMYVFQALFKKTQFLNYTLHLEDPFTTLTKDYKSLFDDISTSLQLLTIFVTMLMMCLSCMIHLYILFGFVYRSYNRNKEINTQIRNVQNMLYRPLI